MEATSTYQLPQTCAELVRRGELALDALADMPDRDEQALRRLADQAKAGETFLELAFLVGELEAMYSEAAKERQEATIPQEGQRGFQKASVVENLPPHTSGDTDDGKAREQAAKATGVSGRSVSEAMYAEDAKKRQLAGLKQNQTEDTVPEKLPERTEDSTHHREAREQAAKATGVSGRSVSEAKKLKQEGGHMTVDVSVRNEGTIVLLDGGSDAGTAWLNEHLPDDAERWGTAYVVEHRYVADILAGAREAGLTVGDA